MYSPLVKLSLYKWKRADVLPDAGGVVHAGQMEGRVLVAPVEGLNAPCHGRMNYIKTPNPIQYVGFSFKIDLLTDFAACV